jgi:hypothetical protein
MMNLGEVRELKDFDIALGQFVMSYRPKLERKHVAAVLASAAYNLFKEEEEDVTALTLWDGEKLVVCRNLDN